ncbi:hypothetical protein ABIE67_007458 [Streptomyces sp. V4I8]|uniref:hypothetical protein n=1 Tax=Streptomyces sp. V4I8 TaxID=3156469 RepID=UPI0035196E78
MRREYIPESGQSGLSTDDLAQPSSNRDLGEDTEARPETPAFPGEATATAGGGEAAPPAEKAATPAEEEPPQLLATEDEESFRGRWESIQNEFVDDPRGAVHKADALVADVMQTLAATFADHKKNLEEQWNQGEEVNTEDLRTALRQYRSFFNRLLTT